MSDLPETHPLVMWVARLLRNGGATPRQDLLDVWIGAPARTTD